MLVALAVSACFVVLELDQLLERGLILCGSVDRSSRHDLCVVGLMWCIGMLKYERPVNKDDL